ncbi:MAG: EAL domain-containing protein [Hylemonella sp.]|nr:EAL domain-containing protein [Hylemonella sp.]
MSADALVDKSRHLALRASVAALLALVAALALPSFSLFEHGSPGMVITHLLLEMFSVVVSVLVVVIAWHAFSGEDRRIAGTLIYAFTVVAGVDIIHALSYDGMPAFGSPSGTAKAIFFWFMGRGFELLAVWLVALQVRLPGHRWHWQLAGGLTVVALFAMGTWRLDWFPQTFVPGHGVTPFKAYIEWVLCAGNLLAAWYFWQTARREQGGARHYYFAAACLVMGLGELTFTTYVDTSDFLVIFGHLFKVAAYALIYAGTFELGMREPYELLQRSERALRGKQAELDAVLRQVPAGVAQLDRQGRYRYVNQQMARMLGLPVDQIVGRSFEEVVAPERRAEVSYRWARAITGQITSYEGQMRIDQGKALYSSVSIAPERGPDDQITGAIAVAIDTTELRQLQTQLMDSMHEVADLKTALDAHAIVAITDARGVITSVNERFCHISKYAREELIGQTHRLINSGHHPASFFHELWRTIASGKVWSGEICNRAKDGSIYWVHTTIVPYLDESGRPQRYVAIRADITERKRVELQVEQMAYQDALTGLPNRHLLMDRLEQSLVVSARSGSYGALLFLDLDHFKEVNDSLGHERGDELLKLVARRLCERVRQSGTVARLGGDEFVVLLSDLGATEAEATTRAGLLGEDLVRTLSEPYGLGPAEINSTPSIGVVMYQGQGLLAEELLKQADMALYQAKDAGRATLCFFDPAIQAAFEKRLALEADLRLALGLGQFEVFYQPIVNSRRQTVGVEALLRWRHPERGMVSPGDFIPLAEKTGLIVPIGQWVIDQACAQMVQWRVDPVRSAWQIAVNVSARQFRQPDFVLQVKKAMNHGQIRAGYLKLEITESSLQDNLAETVEKMKLLRAHGVRFAIDDFGTGYSSLSYLKTLPIDVLKIDRSFVSHVDSNEDDTAIAKTILSLAAHLGLDVVAEGVETEAQFTALCAYGCHLFQGYLLGRPVPVHELDREPVSQATVP